ncbi:hypothetical protein BDW02DRAFT_488052 [Decorospora gaudefroyi]|uniref:Zn(2)-C6 fungal-type domain-containing protein n=1 Tax=Decorospora gaudefroyi TaxID=184978 RepID=A0A6A5KU94_9PLEO|nr:hypothetical protein BDW02DRAFT_488052 [Decorospora gaudefroyi]
MSSASYDESTPSTPGKRRRLESVDPARTRKRLLEGRYSDAYRLLFNEDVNRAAARFDTASDGHQPSTTTTRQIGASTWAPKEQAAFFAALARRGRDDLPAIAAAIATKSIAETRELLLLLHDAATKHRHVKLTLRDIPAAVQVGAACDEQLDLAAESLAWFQETFEASQERDKFGDYWLITPAIADSIEDALSPGRRRATTSPLTSEAEPSRRGGRVVRGACTACKKFKQKCDRQTPCSNCVRRKTNECAYPPDPIKPEQRQRASDSKTGPSILEAIPEATLLQPHVMLTLSKTLFMNRSPTLPSPWPHWSEYTSEFAKEPAIYRTAFNDFHTLLVSLTKRLMQTAITQAISRLRAQRRRVKKGLIPLVKRRDVWAAIDIVGMERNGRERWRGVARRCGLRVYHSKRSRWAKENTKREVPWDQVEQIMAVAEPTGEAPTTDVEESDHRSPNFRSRAARSGTPLPIESLALSDSEDESDTEDEARPSSRPPQSRDTTGRHLMSLEQFDQEASRQDERALWELLGLEPPVQEETKKSDGDSDEDSLVQDEKIATFPDGWRSWIEYHPEWEEFHTPVSLAEFAANQKPLGVPPTLQTEKADSADSDPSRTEPVRKQEQHNKHEALPANELQIRGARAYAALQTQASELADLSDYTDDTNDRSDVHERRQSPTDSTDTDVDQPTQSIETDSHRMPVATSDPESSDIDTDQPTPSIETGTKQRHAVYSEDEVEEMDWESFI